MADEPMDPSIAARKQVMDAALNSEPAGANPTASNQIKPAPEPELPAPTAEQSSNVEPKAPQVKPTSAAEPPTVDLTPNEKGLPAGAAFIQGQIDKGEDPGKVMDFASQKKQEMLDAGVPLKEVQEYWGERAAPEPTAALMTHINTNFDKMTSEQKLGLTPANGVLDNFYAGFGMSSTALLKQAPTKGLDVKASFWEKAAYETGQMLGDLPTFGAGALVGAGVGAAAGAPTGPADPALAGYGAVAMGSALNAVTRKAMVDYYADRVGGSIAEPPTKAEFLQEASGLAWEGLKSAMEGVVGYKIGGAVGDFVGAKSGSKAAGWLANQVGFVGGAAGVGAALGDGMPDAKDFMVYLPVALLGAGAGHLVGAAGSRQRVELSPAGELLTKNSMRIYQETGIGPREQKLLADRDQHFAELLRSPLNADGTPHPDLAAYKKAEPAPHVPEPEPKVTGETEAKAATPQEAVPSLHETQAKNVQPEKVDIEDISGESTYGRRGEALQSIKGFIFHHTGSPPNLEGNYPDAHIIISGLNQPKPDAPGGYGVQYIMERNGAIYRALPWGARGAHVLPSEINDLNNGNAEGMEIIAKDDSDVTPAQISAAVKFAKVYSKQHPGVQYFGHGEINPGHKMADEGLTVANAVREDEKQQVIKEPSTQNEVPLEKRTLLGFAHGSIDTGAASTPPVKGIDGSTVKAPDSTEGFNIKPAGGEAKTASPANQVGSDPVNILYELEHFGAGRHLGDGGPEPMSSARAKGPMQITPATAQYYKLDYNQLDDPNYARHAAQVIYADLSKRSTKMPDGSSEPWGMQDVAVAYNMGTRDMDAWIKGGRQLRDLPAETQKYLLHYEELTGANYGRHEAALTDRLHAQGDVQPDTRAAPEEQTEGARPPRSQVDNKGVPHAEWAKFDPDTKDVQSAELLPNGSIVPAPEKIVGYLQDFGRAAGFKFLSGPPEPESRGRTGAEFQQRTVINNGTGEIAWQARHVYMPQTPDELQRKWGNMDPYRILYHEVGHALDYHMNHGFATEVLPPGPLRDEIIGASKAYAPESWAKQPDYQMKPSELMANAIAKWMTDPTIRGQMPEFTAKYGKALQPFLEMANRYLPVRVGNKWELPGWAQEAADAQGTGTAMDVAGAGGAGGGQPPREAGIGSEGEPPKRIEGYGFNTLEAVKNRILSNFTPAVAKEWLKPRKLLTAFQGQLRPARTQLGGSAEDLLRMTFASRERALQMYKFGTFMLERDGRSVNWVPKDDNSMQKAFDQVGKDGGDLEGYWTTRVAASTVRLAERGISRPVTVEDAMHWLKNPGNVKKYEKAMEITVANDHAHIDNYHTSGMVNEEGAYQLKNSQMFHMVWRKAADPSYVPPMPGKGFIPSQMLKQIKNRTKGLTIDPATTELDNKLFMQASGDRNVALQNIRDSILEQNKTLPPDRQIPFRPSGDSPDSAFIGDLLDSAGRPITKADFDANPALQIAAVMRRTKPGDFPIWDDGRVTMWRAGTPELAELLNTTHPAQADALSKVLSGVAKIDRLGITGALDFMVRAVGHMTMASVTVAEGGAVFPLEDVARSLMSMIQGTWPKQLEMARTYGALSTMVDKDSWDALSRGNSVFKKTGTLDFVPNVIRHPIDALRVMQHKVTQLSQVSFMQRNMAKGVEPLAAAMLARKSSLDYSEKFQSDFVNKWATWAPFMSTGIKDVNQFHDAMKDRPLETLAKIALNLTLPAMTLYAYNWAVDQTREPGHRYVDLPAWERYRYFMIPVPDGQGGAYIRLPKPYVVGWFGATLPEHMLSMLRADDPERFKSVMDSFLQQVVPPNIPTMLMPFIETYANKQTSGFQDLIPGLVHPRPLIPASMENNSPDLQYGPNTSEPAKAVARLTASLGLGSLSPITIDTFTRDMLGTVPYSIVQALGQPWHQNGTPKEMADIPFVGSFYARHPGAEAHLDLFYDRYERVVQAHANIRSAIKQQDPDLLAMERTNPDLVKLSQFAKAISKGQAVIKAIDQNKQMTDAEKLKFTDAMVQRLIQVADQGTAIIDKLGRR